MSLVDSVNYSNTKTDKVKIKLLDDLANVISKRKDYKEKLRVYKAGVKDELLTKLQTLEEIKTKDISETEKKLTDPSTTDVSLREEESEYDQLKRIVNELGIFKKPMSKLNATARVDFRHDPTTGEITATINELHPVKIDKMDLIYKKLYIQDKVFPFNKNVIDLMRGDEELENKTLKELVVYASILETANTDKKGRLTKVHDMIHKKEDYPDVTSESPPASEATSADKDFINNAHIFKNQILQERQKYLNKGVPESQVTYQAIKDAKQYFMNQHQHPVSSEYLDQLYQYIIDKNLFYQGQGLDDKDTLIKFLSDDPVELLERLEILISAKTEGHNNVFNEIHAILKRLLDKKVITKKQYKSLANKSKSSIKK